MTIEAINIYRNNLNEQMGEDGAMSEPAIIDPSGVYEKFIYGFFDENYIADNKDDGNVYQKNVVARFCVSQLPYEVKILQGLDLMIERTGTIYNINYVMTDDNGIQVLYLV